MPSTPTHIAEINPPLGTTIRIGQAAAAFGQPVGGTQIQIMERVQPSWVGSTVKLPEFIIAPISPVTPIEPIIP